MRRLDAIVIGAGQAGPSLVGKLMAVGLTVACTERKLFGGTCVTTGCMPTKRLVDSAYAAGWRIRPRLLGSAISQRNLSGIGPAAVRDSLACPLGASLTLNGEVCAGLPIIQMMGES